MSGFLGSPFLSRLAERSLRSLFGTSLADNMIFTASAAVACGLSAISGEPLRSAYPFIFAAMALAWIFGSAAAGFLKQWFFLFYAAGFWFLPRLFIDAARSPTKTEEFTALNEMLARLAELITEAAPKILTEHEEIRFTASEIFLAVSLLLFFAGFLARKRAKRSRLYCEIRLKMIQNPSE